MAEGICPEGDLAETRADELAQVLAVDQPSATPDAAEPPTVLVLRYDTDKWEPKCEVHVTGGAEVVLVKASLLDNTNIVAGARQQAKAFEASLRRLPVSAVELVAIHVAEEEGVHQRKRAKKAVAAARNAAQRPDGLTVAHLDCRIAAFFPTPGVEVVDIDVDTLLSPSKMGHGAALIKVQNLPPSLKKIVVHQLGSWQSALKPNVDSPEAAPLVL